MITTMYAKTNLTADILSDEPVLAIMNYVRPTGDLVYDQTHMGPGGQELVDSMAPHQVAIHNARPLQHDFTLDSHGFRLENTDFPFTDFLDDSSVENEFYPQVIEFLKQKTGANSALLFDHTVRSNEGRAETTARRAPVKTVHNDYTPKSALHRVTEELEKQNRPDLTGKRHIFVNLWMPLFHTVEESPLAIGDARTFAEDDYHTLRLIYPDREGQIYAVSHSKKHHWYYFPCMTTNEALLFKVFDSNSESPVRYVPHSAFTDSSSPANARPRTSMEIRSILFFD